MMLIFIGVRGMVSNSVEFFWVKRKIFSFLLVRKGRVRKFIDMVGVRFFLFVFIRILMLVVLLWMVRVLVLVCRVL